MGGFRLPILFLKYHLLILGHLFTVAIKADRALHPYPSSVPTWTLGFHRG